MSRDIASPDGRIRVAFCIDNMNVGGTELNAIRLAERIDRDRFDLRALCLQDQGPLIARYEAAGIPVLPIKPGTLYRPRAVRRGAHLARWLKANGIEVLHAHDMYSNVFAVPWARSAGVRTIASRRWWEGVGGWPWRFATRAAYRVADVVLANSEAVGEMLREVDSVPRHKIAVVPNFLDEAAFEPPDADSTNRLREELGLRTGDRVVGIVANLHPIKNHASLIEAVRSLLSRWPTLRLVLVGDGDLRSDLEQMVTRLGLTGTVIFAGRRPHTPNLHHLFEISVLCSLSEGLSNSILEAMAAGNPVVATDVGAARDAVVDGSTGIVVPPADADALAGALASLLADPDLARRLGEAGKDRARTRYSAVAAVSATESLYTRLAALRSRQGSARSRRGWGTAADPPGSSIREVEAVHAVRSPAHVRGPGIGGASL